MNSRVDWANSADVISSIWHFEIAEDSTDSSSSVGVKITSSLTIGIYKKLYEIIVVF